jgi:hypothetical protein
MTNTMVKHDAELFALGFTKGREAETVRIANKPDPRIKELQKRVKHLESGLNWIAGAAERPVCLCGRITGTAAIKSVAIRYLGSAFDGETVNE